MKANKTVVTYQHFYADGSNVKTSIEDGKAYEVKEDSNKTLYFMDPRTLNQSEIAMLEIAESA